MTAIAIWPQQPGLFFSSFGVLFAALVVAVAVTRGRADR